MSANMKWRAVVTYILTYLLTSSMEQSPSSESNGSQLVMKFSTLKSTRRFSYLIHKYLHLSLF